MCGERILPSVLASVEPILPSALLVGCPVTCYNLASLPLRAPNRPPEPLGAH